MTRKTKLLIAAALVALASTAAVTGVGYARSDGHQGGWGAHGGSYAGHHAKRHQGRHHGGRMDQMMKRFDADGDGKLTQAEIDQSREANLAKFDANQDGELSLAEFEALWLDFMRERMVDRFQDLDANGDAAVTLEEYKEPFDAIVVRMDRNGDGALSRDDKRAWHKDKRKSRDSDD